MMTQEDRITTLHKRMNILREKQERRKTVLLGTGGCLLAACLVFVILNYSTGGSGGTAGLYSGATMLFKDAGGYVVAAVVAFMVGVIITVVCIKQRTKHEKDQNETIEEKNKKE